MKLIDLCTSFIIGSSGNNHLICAETIDRTIDRIATIPVWIMTLGTAKVEGRILIENRKLEKNYVYDKITRLYHIIARQSDKDIGSKLRYISHKLEGKNNEEAIKILENEVYRQGSTLDKLVKDQEALNILFEDRELRKVIGVYAKKNKDEIC